MCIEYSQIHANFVGIHSVCLLIRHIFFFIRYMLLNIVWWRMEEEQNDRNLYTDLYLWTSRTFYEYNDNCISSEIFFLHLSTSVKISLFVFIYLEGNRFWFFLPGDRPKPGIRRRYSAHFSYWRDRRGWTQGSHFQLRRLPRLIRIQRVLCKFQAAGRMERNYRPPHPRFLAWKGSLHSGSLPSAKHNRSVSHCELTSHQFISSYAYMFS